MLIETTRTATLSNDKKWEFGTLTITLAHAETFAFFLPSALYSNKLANVLAGSKQNCSPISSQLKT